MPLQCTITTMPWCTWQFLRQLVEQMFQKMDKYDDNLLDKCLEKWNQFEDIQPNQIIDGQCLKMNKFKDKSDIKVIKLNFNKYIYILLIFKKCFLSQNIISSELFLINPFIIKIKKKKIFFKHFNKKILFLFPLSTQLKFVFTYNIYTRNVYTLCTLLRKL